MAVKGIPFSTRDLSATAYALTDGQGVLLRAAIRNLDAAAVCVKYYDKAAAPTEADTPIQRFWLDAGDGIVDQCPINFTLKGWARCVTEEADNGTTSPTANKVWFSGAKTNI